MPLEIVGTGYEEIVGDDYGGDEYMGAEDDDIAALLSAAAGARARGRGGPAYRQALARRLADSRGMVVRKEPTKSRKFILGFIGTTNLAAAGTETVTSRPQVLYKPVRLTVSPASAPSFTITSITIGKNNQLITTDAVPADSFTADAVDMGIEFDTCPVSANISIGISNISNAPATFRASMVGLAVE